MVCKYCGSETTNANGVCDKCFSLLNGEQMEDIFSSSTKKVDTINKPKPRITFPTLTATDGEMPAYAPPRIAAKIKSSKPLLIGFLLVVGIVFMLLLFMFGIFKTSSMRISDALEKGNYETAYEIYKDKFADENSNALNRVLDERLQLIYADFSQGVINYASAETEVETISKMVSKEFESTFKKHTTLIENMKSSKEGYEKGVENHAKSNFSFAIECFRKVLKNDCNYEDAQIKLNLSIMSYKNDALSNASEAVSNGNYNEGVKILENALEVVREDALISKRIDEYKKSGSQKTRKDVIDTVDMLVLKEDYLGAIKCIENAIKNNDELKDDKTLSTNLVYYKQKYAEKFEKDIENIINRKDYEKAGILLNQAEEIIPNNDIYIVKKAELSGKVPVYLDKLDPSEKENWKQNKGSAIDSFGIDRSEEENYFILKTSSTASYYIDGKYKTFTASFAASKKIDDAVKCKVKITATVGGEYLYKECEISADTKEQDISFKIKDCTSLSFTVIGEGANVIMYNAKLSTK